MQYTAPLSVPGKYAPNHDMLPMFLQHADIVAPSVTQAHLQNSCGATEYQANVYSANGQESNSGLLMSPCVSDPVEQAHEPAATEPYAIEQKGGPSVKDPSFSVTPSPFVCKAAVSFPDAFHTPGMHGEADGSFRSELLPASSQPYEPQGASNITLSPSPFGGSNSAATTYPSQFWSASQQSGVASCDRVETQSSSQTHHSFDSGWSLRAATVPLLSCTASGSRSQHHNLLRPKETGSSSGGQPMPGSAWWSGQSIPPYQQPLLSAEPKKPGRTGSMPEPGRLNATKRRFEKTVCVYCKIKKRRCDRTEESHDCKHCRHAEDRASCCTPFFFKEMAENTTQFTELHALLHSLMSQFSLRYNDVMDFNEMCKDLDALVNRHNVRHIQVSGGQGYLYDLDLAHCRSFLGAAADDLPRPTTLERLIIDSGRRLPFRWQECVRVRGSDWMSRNPLEALHLFDDASEAAMFTPIPMQEAFEYDGGLQKRLAFVGILLSIFVGRQVEVAAFADLHAKLSDQKQHFLEKDMDDLGKRLLVLRRNFWKGYSATATDRYAAETELASYSKATTQICRKLYLCFCLKGDVLRGKGNRDGGSSQQQTRANLGSYPKVYSQQGFQEWMWSGDRP
ncbi:hypothetical protein RJ55_03348 [Drechmeria coniospora]|nr:hypothetical protein RJ55_03348 [Drechmeria coniospora]